MSNSYVKRVTLFKVPKEEDIETVLKQYEVLRQTAVKVYTLLHYRRCSESQKLQMQLCD